MTKIPLGQLLEQLAGQLLGQLAGQLFAVKFSKSANGCLFQWH